MQFDKSVRKKCQVTDPLCCHRDLCWHFNQHDQNRGAQVDEAGLNLARNIS